MLQKHAMDVAKHTANPSGLRRGEQHVLELQGHAEIRANTKCGFVEPQANLEEAYSRFQRLYPRINSGSRSNSNAVRAARRRTSPSRPIRVKERASSLIGAFIRVRSKVIALRLHQIR
jgi:hypothetical protein